MKLTLLFSNVAGFRGDTTMNFIKYCHHSLTLHPPDNKQNLDELVALAKKEGADLIGLTEIDRCAHWSKRVDQTKYLAKNLGVDYFYGQNYKSPWPFIYTADTGNAVLSKFPIDKYWSKVQRFKHGHVCETFTDALIGSKHFVHTIHDLPDRKTLHVVCTHFSTNFKGLRELNACDIVEYLLTNIIPSLNPRDAYIFMGDLNTVPLYTEKKNGFSDNYEDLVTRMFPDDYNKERTLYILRRSGLFKSTMAVNPFDPRCDDGGRYGTYPQKPNRMIDYIFVSPNVKTSDIETIPVGFSDHRVIKTIVEIPD